MPNLILCEPLTCSFFLLSVMLTASEVLLECLLNYSCKVIVLPVSLVFQHEQLHLIQASKQSIVNIHKTYNLFIYFILTPAFIKPEGFKLHSIIHWPKHMITTYHAVYYNLTVCNTILQKIWCNWNLHKLSKLGTFTRISF